MKTRFRELIFASAMLAFASTFCHTALAQPSDALVKELQRRWERRRSAAYERLLRSSDPTQQQLNQSTGIQLMGVDGGGHPIYYITHNLDAAATTSTSEVWPGGISSYNLTGSGTAPGVLGIWDQGLANFNHVELVGRVLAGETAYRIRHSTHVGGTMIAAGIDPQAKGMSYEGLLLTFDWDDDVVEMAQQAAAGLQISNHSYGIMSGWSGLQWWGETTLSNQEDWRFGFYDSLAAEYDQIARAAPYYLIVKSAGNDRNDVQNQDVHNHMVNGQLVMAYDHHPPDGYPFGFDTIADVGCAKNIITVGAVKDIPGGYTQPADVVQTDFSSWGPADDGRIKPDIVANGDSVYSASTYPDLDTSYEYMSGTSMAAPNVSGSLNLIRELYENTYPGKPRSATLKALVLHTADEAGAADGPDYSNGWGLLNTHAACDVVTAVPSSGMGHVEALLVNSNTDYYEFNVPVSGDARVTVAWTDLPGTPPPYVVDPVANMLVNDLDVTLQPIGGALTMYYPWKLDKTNPLGVATRGDNDVDNVERIDAYNIPAGSYRVAVTHEGPITGGEQPYTLVWSGLYPTTASGVEAGASPPRLQLAVPYPNPASGGLASIEFSTESAGPAAIDVFDATGRHVKTLLKGMLPAGPGSVRLDTGTLPSGIYFVKMRAASRKMVRKITVVR